MGSYTKFSRDTVSVENKKLWDPLETLGIINTDPGYQGITCIGYAPSQRRRCRNPIRADNRQFITATLNELAYLNPHSSAITLKLRAIAGPALCVSRHQNQVETVVSQWQEKIKQVKPQIRERIHTHHVPSTQKQDCKRDQALEDAQEQLREMKTLLTELREELNRQRRQDQGREQRGNNIVEDRKDAHPQNRERKSQCFGGNDWGARREDDEREERERIEKEEEKERQKKEQQEKERQEKEQHARREKEAREQAAQNERLRQRAQKRREEQERENREKGQKERAEWDQSWARYHGAWAAAPNSVLEREVSRDSIPWPVKSGSYRDVNETAVKKFFQMAIPRDTNMGKLKRTECQKWHPDRTNRWTKSTKLTDADRGMVDMICRVVTSVEAENTGKS